MFLLRKTTRLKTFRNCPLQRSASTTAMALTRNIPACWLENFWAGRARQWESNCADEEALSKAVIVHAAGLDQYQAVFSLAELDPAMASHPALLTWSRNSEPLPSTLGPLRLVVPDDKRQARWVRQVTAIEVISVASSASTNASAESATGK